MLRTEVNTSDFSDIFRRFCLTIGERHWKKRTKLILDEIRHKRILKSYLLEENAIAFALTACSGMVSNHGAIASNRSDVALIYPALGFAAQALSIIENSGKEHAERFIGRIRGAFNNPDDMRALRLELTAATHFSLKGWNVTWPEMYGLGQFDILVTDLSQEGFEIECKSFSGNKGRKIQQRWALELFNMLSKELRPICGRLHKSIAVVVTLPDRPPDAHEYKVNLTKSVVSAIISNGNASDESGASIRIEEFETSDLVKFDESGSATIIRSTLDRITKTVNRESLVIGRREGTSIVTVLQCTRADSVLDSIFNVAADASKRQLSKSRPAFIFMGLDSLTEDELSALAEQQSPSQPTAIALSSTEFLSSKSREHVVGITFVSPSLLRQEESGVIAAGGRSYTFLNRSSKYWSNDFERLFS